MKLWPWARANRKLILASGAIGYAWAVLVWALCRFVFTNVGVPMYLFVSLLGCAIIGVYLGVEAAHRVVEARDRDE